MKTSGKYLQISLFLSLVMALTFSSFSLVDAAAKKVTKPVVKKPAAITTPAQPTCPVCAPVQTCQAPAPVVTKTEKVAIAQPVAPVVSAPVSAPLDIKGDSFEGFSLLQNYINLRGEIDYNMTAAGDTDCSISMSNWNNYLLPYFEGLRNYAQKRNNAYVVYVATKEYESMYKYFSTFKKGCLIGLKAPANFTAPEITYNKKDADKIREYLIADFSSFQSDIRSNILFYSVGQGSTSTLDCDGFRMSEWSYIFKPRLNQYLDIANKYGLSAETDYINAYIKGLNLYYKDRCAKNLDQ